MTPRQAGIAADLFTAAVVASVGIALAGLTWRALGDAGTAAVSPAGAIAPAPQPIDVAPVIALAPFGHAGIVPGQAPATSLAVQLKGVLLAIPRAASTAIIAEGTNPAKAYRIGESVAGATIAAIGADYVMLDISGRTEQLSFPKAAPPPSAAGAAAAPAALPMAAPPPSAAPPPPPAIPSLGQIGEAVPGQGFRIGGDPPAALLSAGIQPGDVIERVNGIDVGDAARAREILGSAALAGGARVDVLRGGRRFTVAISR